MEPNHIFCVGTLLRIFRNARRRVALVTQNQGSNRGPLYNLLTLSRHNDTDLAGPPAGLRPFHWQLLVGQAGLMGSSPWRRTQVVTPPTIAMPV